ncbi:MAG: helix-turn-helix domain-containing protein [Armatimonadota bacterium]|nr:helix-turn-helix domain-containing protein [Armatimonadota bacterium]
MPKKESYDPIKYIEQAFLDIRQAESKNVDTTDIDADVDSIKPFTRDFVSGAPTVTIRHDAVKTERKPRERILKLKTTQMNAPRPRRRHNDAPASIVDDRMEQVWMLLPKNLKFLAGVYDDDVTQKYYTKEFGESREDLISRLVDPELSLEETARLLGVCPATVRRYTNRGWLRHHRTRGNQRRFRLSGLVDFVERYGRNPE